MYILEVDNLSYEINNKKILDKISFKIKEGDFLSLIGENGSGKSTLSLALVKLIESKGNIVLKGKIGVVLENPDHQIIGTTVEEDIVFGLQNIGLTREKMEERLIKTLTSFKMEHLRKREVITLSGGQKQKLAIASLVAMEYDVYIFDEVTSMLDPNSKKMINNLIKKLNKEGKTIIQISHFIEEIKLSNNSLLLKNGKLIYYGKTNDLMKDEKLLLSNNLVAKW